ncbi:MAG TPA: BON domain-containing protein [Burkholderiales bacterium]|nr:BON domain-containing protein [Burkholderiales bacterium]
MRALLLVAFLAASAAACAQPSDFSALDRNQDGYLSRLEVMADPEIAKRFAQFDLDKDRRLSEAEYAAARADNERRAQRDALVTARVKEALLAASGIPSKGISVETYEGRVQLSGFVPVADMASRAGRVVASVNGVLTVHNNLSVK